MADGGGKNELPCRRAHTCHSTTAAAITAHRATTRPDALLTPAPASTSDASAVPGAGVRLGDERADPVAADPAGEVSGADVEDDGDAGRQPDPGGDERRGAGQVHQG